MIQPKPYCLAVPRAATQESASNVTLCLLLSRIDLLQRSRSARLLKVNLCVTIANLCCTFCTPNSVQSFYFPFSAVAPEPTASIEVSIGVAPSALSFFSVKSRWCSITLRFLKYVTCTGISIALKLYFPHSPFRKWCTHPTTRACALKFSEFRRAHFSCLLVFPYAVDDVVAIQTLEETVAAIPAYCASTAVGRYETAILRGCGRRRRRLRRRSAEPAHGECVLCGG